MVLKKLMNKDSEDEKDQKSNGDKQKKQQSNDDKQNQSNTSSKKQSSSKKQTKSDQSNTKEKKSQSSSKSSENKSEKKSDDTKQSKESQSSSKSDDKSSNDKAKSDSNKQSSKENGKQSKQQSSKGKSDKKPSKTKDESSSKEKTDDTSSRSKQNIDLDNFVVTSEIEDLVERSKQYLKARYPVHFTGPAGVGKTSLALYLASQYEQPVLFLQGNHEMNNVDLIGGANGFSSSKTVDNFIRSVYKHEERVNENWHEGHLVKAVKNGYTVIYDEFTRSKPETNNLLLSLLEEGILPLYGTKQKDAFVRAHPNFKIIFTSNPEEYAGVYQSQDALRDRLITLELNRGSTETEIKMVQERTGIEEDEAKVIVQLVENIRKLCEKEEVQGPSFRGSVMIGEIARQNDIEIKADNDDFISLCKDVLGASVGRCLGKKEAKKKIADELKKL
ncbi:gas vesicle protein GvpN [Alteribacter keqinensis]|nr:gas vesicle protein GvpN [Alteribacter keqinensis]